MATDRGPFLRENAFLLAAIALPLAVVLFFVVATAIPRLTVPAPQHDAVLRADNLYSQANPRVSVDFALEDGRVEARFRLLPETGYAAFSGLFLFDHTTMTVSAIPLVVPADLKEGDPPRVVVVDALAGRAVVPGPAPDGYQLESRGGRGAGLVGDLFGMNRYESGAAFVRGGRVVPIRLPEPYQYQSYVYLVGWITENGR